MSNVKDLYFVKYKVHFGKKWRIKFEYIIYNVERVSLVQDVKPFNKKKFYFILYHINKHVTESACRHYLSNGIRFQKNSLMSMCEILKIHDITIQ